MEGNKLTLTEKEDLNELMEMYHAFTNTVAVYPEANTGMPPEIAYLSLGLVSEAGEAADIGKKIFRRGHREGTDYEKLKGELGDVLFYWTRLCYTMGLDPAEVMQSNIEKLSGRKESGTLKDR